MDGTNPKISFIPKGSLVREESFLERSRPRSVIGVTAISVFVLVFGVFVGLSVYNNSLNAIVAEKTEEIKNAQKEFSDAPEVLEAKNFQARANLARELLDSHLVASPVFKFLSDNTVTSVYYDKFLFSHNGGVSSLQLSGEAQSYASLANQIDTFQKQQKILEGLFVDNISLTNFGSVTFTFTMTFNPNFLLYTKNIEDLTTTNVEPVASTPVVVDDAPSNTQLSAPLADAPKASASSTVVATPEVPSVVPTEAQEGASSSEVEGEVVEAPLGVAPAPLAEPSFMKAFWLKFKFW